MADVMLPLELRIGGEPVRCEQVVRSLPGRRMVCRGAWGQQRVFVKLYTHPHRGRRHWQRERRGLQALLERGIAAPAILLAGRTESGWALVLPELPAARSAAKLWEQGGERQRRDLVERLVEVLALHHQAGLLQRDLHLENFVESGRRIYTLDGAGIERRRGPVGWRDALDNLALLLAQLPPGCDHWQDELLERYVEQRGRSFHDRTFARRVRRARSRRLVDFRRKVMRECSAVRRVTGSGRLMLVDRQADDEALAQLLADPDRSLMPEGLLKVGNTATLWRVQVGDRELVVKRYNTKGVWHGLKLRLRRSRALVSWQSAHMLRFFGLPTPAPRAVLVRRDGLLRTTAYFISDFEAGVAATDWFADPLTPGHEKAVMAQRIARILGIMHAQNVSHGDLKASNILIKQLEPVLIDLDAMRLHCCRFLGVRAMRNDRERLLRNWKPLPLVHAMFAQALTQNGRPQS